MSSPIFNYTGTVVLYSAGATRPCVHVMAFHSFLCSGVMALNGPKASFRMHDSTFPR